MSDTPYAPRRVLVTGATGYVGGRLTRRLVEQGIETHILVRTSSQLATFADIENRLVVHCYDGSISSMQAAVSSAKPEVVFHLASLYLTQHRAEDLDRLVQSNIQMPTHLLEAMAGCGVRYLVNTGTSWQHQSHDENQPVNLYAATKQAFEAVVDYYASVGKMKVCTLKLFDTYGPDDPRGKLISLLWRTALARQPLYMSPGEQEIDLVHVEDVVDAFVHTAGMLPNQAQAHTRYGLSSGQPVPLKSLVEAFELATGLTVPIVWGGRPYRDREVMTTWRGYSPLPGWLPTRRFETAIAHTRP